jgi:hypothetical protein
MSIPIRPAPKVKPRIVTLQTFAALTETAPRTVRDLIERKVIPVIKIRKWVRIPLEEALAALDNYKRPAISVDSK